MCCTLSGFRFCLSELFNIHFVKIPPSKVMKLNAEISLINYLIDHIFIGGITQKNFGSTWISSLFCFIFTNKKMPIYKLNACVKLLKVFLGDFPFHLSPTDSALSLELLLCLEEPTYYIDKLFQKAKYFESKPLMSFQ